MAVQDLKGSRIITGLTATPATLADAGEGGGRVKVWVETVEVGNADSVSSTYHMARLPSNARILGMSKIYFDDLATVGSPTLDIGIYNTSSRTDITDDADALNDGIDCATAAGSASLVKDISNYGKRLYEYVNGQTTDPKCDLDIKVKLLDADLSATPDGNTITVEIFYAYD